MKTSLMYHQIQSKLREVQAKTETISTFDLNYISVSEKSLWIVLPEVDLHARTN